jgi:hypothetical protein
MLVYTMSDLRVLARTFTRETGVELTTIGYRANVGWRFFVRLEEGRGCSAKGAEQATEWFLANWPVKLPWPKSIPDQRRRVPVSNAA